MTYKPPRLDRRCTAANTATHHRKFNRCRNYAWKNGRCKVHQNVDATFLLYPNTRGLWWWFSEGEDTTVVLFDPDYGVFFHGSDEWASVGSLLRDRPYSLFSRAIPPTNPCHVTP